MKATKKLLSITLTLAILLSMIITTSVTASALNSDDYRTWTHHDSRWSSTAMGSGTLGSGGAPTTAITKLAIQAGLRDARDFDIGSMATLLTNNSGYSGNAIVWGAPAKSSLNLFSSYKVLKQGTDSTPSFNSSSNYQAIIGYINDGYHLVIQATNSSGTNNYIAVDEEKTLSSGSVYIMDCLNNTSNNINVLLHKRYSTFTRIIGYKGEASSNSSVDSDYRKWERNNANWKNTVLAGSYTVGNSRIGGGDLVMAASKLAVQAGLLEKNNAVTNAVTAIKAQGSFSSSGGVIPSWDAVKTALGFSGCDSALMGDADSDTATMSTTLDTNINNIINYLNQGYYLVIRVNNSVGWVAVDTEKTLSTGEVYIMRSTPDSSKNADIKLSDYYSTINRVGGFMGAGVQVKLSGNADFTASYTKSGSTVSFTSGAFVPDGAEVTVTASPKSGYTAGSGGTYWTNTNFSGSESGNHLTYTFTANTATATSTTLTFNTSPKTSSISYTYAVNSGSFNYTTIPSTAQTGDTVGIHASAKSDATFVYELVVTAEDSDGNEIEVTHDQTDRTKYTFTMPSSNVTVTFTGRNADDWRKWARDDERWRDYEMNTQTNVNPNVTHTVQSDGAVMLSLAKIVVQTGLKTPSTNSEHKWDVRDTVDALANAKYIDMGDGSRGLIYRNGQLVFSSDTYKPPTYDNSATALDLDSIETKLSASNTSTRKDITSKAYLQQILGYTFDGAHQIFRIVSSSITSADDFSQENSEWFVIDEEKTLVNGIEGVLADSSSTAQDIREHIYIFRATADTSKNANITLQDLYNETNYRYVWRNYAYLGGTTPSRKINYSVHKDGTNFSTDKCSLSGKYTIDGGKSYTDFDSGDYVPSRATVTLTADRANEYYSFDSWEKAAQGASGITEVSRTNNSITFTLSPSEFRTTNQDYTSGMVYNITPAEYNVFYEDGANFSYSNTVDTCSYNDTASFVINPASGYTVLPENIVLKDSEDNVLSITVSKSGKTYSFTMPAKDVYISATATEQTYDDYRMWGINDSRWQNVYYAGSSYKMPNTSDNGSDILMAYAKLMIQAGYQPSTVAAVYDANDSETGRDFVSDVCSATNTYGSATYPWAFSDGSGNARASMYDTDGTKDTWALIAYRLRIVPHIYSYTTGTSPNQTTTYYCQNSATAGGSRSQAFMYPRLLNTTVANAYSLTGTKSGVERAYTKLIMDYLEGNHSRITDRDLCGSYTANTNNYKFHLMIYNTTYGWMAIDEAQTLNTGKVWAWASKNAVANNDTGSANIICLEDAGVTSFTRLAGFKFQSSTNQHFETSKVNFTPYEYNNDSTASTNATLNATYEYMGQSYGPYPSGLYVPNGASVTISKATINDGFKPAASTSDTYKPWSTTLVPTISSDNDFTFDTAFSSGTSRVNCNARYYIEALPTVHIKYRGGPNGSLYGQSDGTTLSNEQIIYQGGSITATPVPDANYEVDKLKFIKTDSSYSSVISEEYVDPYEFVYYFDTDRTGGAECYYIVEATFVRTGHPLAITYNYKEFDPTSAGTYEYTENDGAHITTNKALTVNIDFYDENATAEALANANAPELRNNYFDYTISSIGSLDTSGDTHTLNVYLAETPHPYSVTVNGTEIGDSFHFQEEITLDYSDYGVGSDDVLWTRDGSRASTDPLYTLRVTGDLTLNVSENLSGVSGVDGTSTIAAGYTEIGYKGSTEQCHQNFYIQDFFDTSAPKAYDSSGAEITDAENVEFLGAGVLFYVHDTSTSKPAKAALDGKVNRSDIYGVLESNKSGFLTQATVQTTNYKNSNLSCSYINFNSDSSESSMNKKLRYAGVNKAYNYFFTASINNNRASDVQKYKYRVYSFYVMKYELGGETIVAPIMSENFAEANVYYNSN